MNRVKKYRKTKKGLIANIYSNQLKSSRTRNKISLDYTLIELTAFLNRTNNFDVLFNRWVESGYDKMKRPSVDRIDNNIGYALDNIQLMTWEENNNKARMQIRSGDLQHKSLLNGGHRSVVQYSLDENKIQRFISVSEASRILNINHQAISRVCRGERTKTHGFTFKYED